MLVNKEDSDQMPQKIWVCTVCLCPIKRIVILNGLSCVMIVIKTKLKLINITTVQSDGFYCICIKNENSQVMNVQNENSQVRNVQNQHINYKTKMR